jgi:sialidase-1
VLEEQTGTIWLLMTRNDGRDKESAIKSKTGLGTRTVWVCRSDDQGGSWSKPVEITQSVKEPAWGWYATGPGVGIQIKHGPHKGRLIIPCDHSYDDPKGNLRGMPVEYGSHVIYSDDRGRSWTLGGVIRPKMNECQAVERADGNGTLLMDMRSYFGRSRRAHSLSRDGGMTWSEPRDHPELVEPVCQASLIRYTWPGKTTKSRILFSNPAHENRRTNMTVRLSYDEGMTWPVQRVLHAGFAAYSCLAALPDSRIGCLYERGDRHASEKITFARFTHGWLTSGREQLLPARPGLDVKKGAAGLLDRSTRR